MPFVIFGIIGILGGLSTFGLPETKGTEIPDTISQAEALGKAGGGHAQGEEGQIENGTISGGKDNDGYVSEKNVDVTMF